MNTIKTFENMIFLAGGTIMGIMYKKYEKEINKYIKKVSQKNSSI